MIPLSVFLFLTLIPATLTQSPSDVTLGIAAIKAHFSNAEIVPSMLTTFDPSALMSVTFGAQAAVPPGTPLTRDQVKAAPSISLTPANSSATFTGNFTLAMVDAGPVGYDESQGQTRHMLINGVTIAGTNVSTASGVLITAYAGPAPPAGTGPHRYVILLYTQPDTFSPPANLSQPGVGVSVFDFPQYVHNSHLGPVVAGTYFTVEEGTASSSISPTSAVVSSTLRPATSITAFAGSPEVTTNSKSSDASMTKASFILVLVTPLLAFLF